MYGEERADWNWLKRSVHRAFRAVGLLRAADELGHSMAAAVASGVALALAGVCMQFVVAGVPATAMQQAVVWGATLGVTTSLLLSGIPAFVEALFQVRVCALARGLLARRAHEPCL